MKIDSLEKKLMKKKIDQWRFAISLLKKEQVAKNFMFKRSA